MADRHIDTDAETHTHTHAHTHARTHARTHAQYRLIGVKEHRTHPRHCSIRAVDTGHWTVDSGQWTVDKTSPLGDRNENQPPCLGSGLAKMSQFAWPDVTSDQ